MPTADRRRFVARAVRCFRRQDYPNLELIVVDDGRDAVGDLVNGDPRVRYVRLENRRTVGAKRNLACEAARGDIIVHWDDDDWSADWRVSYQVAELLRAGADVCGLRNLAFYDAAARRAWRYSYPARAPRGWVAGGTLCYTKAFWSRNRFPDVRVGEDAAFVWARTNRRLLALDDDRFYVALIHAGNTSRKATSDRRWHPRPVDEIRGIMGQDPDDFFAADPSRDGRREQVHVTVSIPYYRCKPYIARAVESVLGQTHADVTVVVVNDGDPAPPWPALSHIDDPRLVRFDLAANGGRYLADAIVLAASDAPYFAVQDADDWSEPHRLEALVRAVRREHAVGAVSAAVCHRAATPVGPPAIQRYPRVTEELTSRFEHRANHHGLFRSAALRLVGGFHGGFRMGYDTFLVNALAMIGRVTYVDEPLYHRRLRPGSLTSAPSTGLRSAVRLAATDRLRSMYAAVFEYYVRYLAGDVGREELVEAIARVAGRHLDPADTALIASEQARLRRAMEGRGSGARPAALEPPRAPAQTRGRAPAAYGLLGDKQVRWSDWSIGRTTAVELVERLEQRRPGRILEIGSGISTAFLASWAAERHAEVVTLEHDTTFHARTRALLEQLGLDGRVDLRLAPLRPRAFPDGHRYAWYDSELEGRFDFILADGPPIAVGRQAVLFAVAQHRSTEWELWLDDGRRDHEQACLALWRRHLDFAATLRDLDGKGQWIIGPHGCDPCAVMTTVPAGVGVTLLTGGRPQLLRETVERLQATAPALLRTCYVLALLNAPDPATESYVDAMTDVDRVVRHRGPRMPTGAATSRLMAEIETGPVEYLLHLEDDWSASTLDTGWLERAKAILDGCPEVGQVRLRHRAEPVLAHHMVTRRRIRWSSRDGFEYSSSSHFTLNPSLMRVRDLAKVFPCRGEADAQQRFLRADLATAQLSPGVFRHIGGDHSLNAKSHEGRPGGSRVAFNV